MLQTCGPGRAAGTGQGLMGILCPWLSQEWRGITIATVVQLRVQAQGLVKGCLPVPAAPSVRAGAAGMTVGQLPRGVVVHPSHAWLTAGAQEMGGSEVRHWPCMWDLWHRVGLMGADRVITGPEAESRPAGLSHQLARCLPWGPASPNLPSLVAGLGWQ